MSPQVKMRSRRGGGPAVTAGALVILLTLTGCSSGWQPEETAQSEGENLLILDRGPHTESRPPDASGGETHPGSESQPQDFTLEELKDMPYEQFRSEEVTRDQRRQLLWHYAQLSSDYSQHFSPADGLDAYNPVDVADDQDEPQEILRQHWYLDQLYRLGELMAADHGGRDVSLKLARVVDRGNVPALRELLETAETDTPAWLLASRYTIEDAKRCLEPPEGTETSLPWSDQTCWEIDFRISDGEATSVMPYFHWTEFETADGERTGFWQRSALHWL